jgi:formamidopyrimidine-DNA glycosylase
MPEYPDIQLYLHALRSRVVGQAPLAIRIVGPNVLRTVELRPEEFVSRRIVRLERIGKRIVFAFESDLFLVLHLMIAGRLQWRGTGGKPPVRPALAWMDFEDGQLVLTELSRRKRAGLWLLRGDAALRALDPGGLEVIGSSLESFSNTLRQENRILKRALTDPTILSGIGNAYSDEILHRARLSPFRRTQQLSDEDLGTLHTAAIEVLREWENRLLEEHGSVWPKKVTAFRDGMAVHGRYGQACPVCAAPVQRVRHGESEFNYCPRCQTGGRILADRSLSRLLREDWPQTLEELEESRRHP